MMSWTVPKIMFDQRLITWNSQNNQPTVWNCSAENFSVLEIGKPRIQLYIMIHKNGDVSKPSLTYIYIIIIIIIYYYYIILIIIISITICGGITIHELDQLF